MSKKRKFFLIFCFIIIDVSLLIGFLVIRDATSFNELKREVNELTKLDVSKDRYNRKIKSSGEYAVVEKAIKEYLDDYAIEIKNISKITDDSRLKTILSYDNYSKDGPKFNESIKYLEDSKKTVNKKIDRLLEKQDKDKMNEFIRSKTQDEYYISMFDELMNTPAMKEYLKDINGSLKSKRDKMNNIYDSSLDILNYLSIYSNDWQLEDGEIKFKSDSMYNYYTGLVSKVQTKS